MGYRTIVLLQFGSVEETQKLETDIEIGTLNVS